MHSDSRKGVEGTDSLSGVSFHSRVGKRAKKRPIDRSALTSNHRSRPILNRLTYPQSSGRRPRGANTRNKKQFFHRRQYSRHSRASNRRRRVPLTHSPPDYYNRVEQTDRNPPIDRTGVVVHRVHRASPRVVVGKRVPSSRCVRPVDRRSQCQKSTPGSPWLRRSFRPSRVEKCRTRSKFEAFFVYTWRV